MFESLHDKDCRSTGQRFLALLCSILIHGLMIFCLIVVPLVYFNLLPEVRLLTLLVAAPPPPIPELAPTPPGTQTAGVPKDLLIERSWAVPVIIPKGIPAPDDEPPVVGVIPGFTAVTPGVANVGSQILLGIPGNLVGFMAPPPPASKRKPELIVSRVQESKLIRKIIPEYPSLALRAHVEGTVILEINVDEEGNVGDVRVLQGNPLLVDEAVRAVKQWKYSPTLLNGEPIPVLSSVTVDFRLKKQGSPRVTV
ncbi:MAG: TonB family protein [Acidobacteriota bacterium]|jgi:protein TonB